MPATTSAAVVALFAHLLPVGTGTMRTRKTDIKTFMLYECTVLVPGTDVEDPDIPNPDPTFYVTPDKIRIQIRVSLRNNKLV